jgi:hypothetical protein
MIKICGDRHDPAQHRGRAALQRRVQRSKKEPGFSPVDGWSGQGPSDFVWLLLFQIASLR